MPFENTKIYDSQTDLIAEKHLEYQKAVSSEIQRLTCLLKKATENLSCKCEQFDQLRDAFVHNLKLLEVKEEEFSQLSSRFTVLKNNFHDQNLQLQKTVSSLEHSQSELVLSRKAEAILKQELLAHKHSFKEYEAKLVEERVATIKTLENVHNKKRAELENEIASLRMTIDVERSNASCELARALRRASDTSNEQINKSRQKQIELESKLRSCEKNMERVRLANEELKSHLETHKNELDVSRSDMLQVCEQVKSLIRESEENKAIVQLEQKRFQELDETRRQEKLEQETLRLQMHLEMEELKKKVESTKSKMESETIAHHQAATQSASRVQQLMDRIEHEKQNYQSLLESLEDCKTARQTAEANTFRANTEVERLRNDLARLLALPSKQSTQPNLQRCCEHTDLVDQLDRLQQQYDQLNVENAKLKKKLVNSPKKFMDDRRKLLDKLQLCKQIIQKLMHEKQTLVELSNRLQSNIRGLSGSSPSLTQKQSRPIYPKCESENNQGGGAHPVRDDALSSLMDNASVLQIFKLLDDGTSSLLSKDNPDKPIKL